MGEMLPRVLLSFTLSIHSSTGSLSENFIKLRFQQWLLPTRYCCSNTPEVRLLRFWEAPNVRKGVKQMSIDMLFLHEKSTLIQGTVNASRVPHENYVFDFIF
ncbi:hypothetical protein Bca4012_039898 [Brassica carinata]